jgi:hypothetical protein
MAQQIVNFHRKSTACTDVLLMAGLPTLSGMKDLLVLIAHLLTTITKLLAPGGGYSRRLDLQAADRYGMSSSRHAVNTSL